MSHTAAFPTQTQPTHRREGWVLWQRWVLAVTIGELAGFAVPSVVGGAATALGLEGIAFAICVVLAGMGEGAALGAAQWLALRRPFPQMGWREWVLPTALAALLAWIIGMVPSTFVDFSTIEPATLIAGGSVLGILFLLTMGGAQWLTLRRYVPHAWWWIVANAVAWPAGVAMPFVTLGVIPDDSPAALMIAAGIVGGVLMGVVVGAITGFALIRLVKTAEHLASEDR